MSLACCTALPWNVFPAWMQLQRAEPPAKESSSPWNSFGTASSNPACPMGSGSHRVCHDAGSRGLAELCYHLELHLELQRKPRKAQSSHLLALLKRHIYHPEDFETGRVVVTVDCNQPTTGFLLMAWTADGIGSQAGRSIHPSSTQI